MATIVCVDVQLVSWPALVTVPTVFTSPEPDHLMTLESSLDVSGKRRRLTLPGDGELNIVAAEGPVGDNVESSKKT